MLQKLAAYFTQDKVLASPPSYFRFSPRLKPEVFFEPCQVWEIQAADLSLSPVHLAAIGRVSDSKGISLRFPRLLRVREDKSPEDATSAEQITEMFNNQAVKASA
jgi:DNA ligase-1